MSWRLASCDQGSNPCPVRSFTTSEVTDHESRDPPGPQAIIAQHGRLAREALGARLAENSAINGRISIHGHDGPCVAHSPRYPISMEPCSPTCWAFFWSLELLPPGFSVFSQHDDWRRQGRELHGQPVAPETNAPRSVQVPWFPDSQSSQSQHGALVEGKLGRRAVDATCPRSRA